MNHELPDVQAGFRKGRGTRDQIANIRWIIQKAREFQKNIYFCFIDYAEAFDCEDHNKLWKILKGIRIPDYCTCFQGRLEASQDTAVGTGQETMNWYKIGKDMLCYAKSLQSCLTLCDPLDGSPPGFPVPGILQAITLEWVAISFSNTSRLYIVIQVIWLMCRVLHGK